MNNSPIIIVGMHRSGTSLCTRILKEAGVFFGNDLSSNYESRYYQNLNIKIFELLGGRWDNPPRFEYLYENNLSKKYIIDELIKELNSSEFLRFLGIKKTFKRIYRDFTWGWKDPRNVFTLQLWLEIYPNAKVIYIERNGVDVANSLKTRSEKYFRNLNESKKHKLSKLENVGRSSLSLRCQKLDWSFQLWEEYVEEGRKQIEILNNNKLLILKYEDLLLKKEREIDRMLDFVAIDISAKKKNTLYNIIKPSRALAYKENYELKDFAESLDSKFLS